ncbi:LytR C-terminal domain-containing protein [Alloscardovia criceti]|uniref:LytR C-terminal domain-containing protein n=1 Tax=Alloscardovia criceti TaxID=356828 RepID=UPI00037742F6|nr:LytR C-terminal domain-containing protein [Alloscardovia criceti]
MARSKNEYPRDEFDMFTGQNGGAHRGRKTVMSRLMPFIIAIVLAGACALGFLTWSNGWLGPNGLNLFPTASTSSSSTDTTSKDSSSSDSSSSSSSSTDSSTSSPTDSSSDTSISSTDTQNSDNSTSEETQQTQVDKSASVYVFNASGITGYAAQEAATLTNNGYTSVTPTNAGSSNLPSVNTVWYVNTEDQATAQDIANQLGISAVQQVSSLSQGQIAVVLLN